MTSTTMDATAKQRVKAALLAQLRTGISSTEHTVRSEQAASDPVPDESYSVDDQSQAYEAGDLTALFEREAAGQQDELERVEALDFALTERVGPGAIVGFGGARYVVAAVSAPFDSDGVSYQGISTDAPIYQAIAGLGVSDRFTFRDREHSIDFLA
ncbi:MAG: hypothetical protein ACK5MT_18855 [Actinomycetales bacterium]